MENISFELATGKIMVIQGKNGSGKSSLLKCIYGILTPDQGEILFEGKLVLGPLFQLIPGHRGMKWVSGEQTLLINHTVTENLRDKMEGWDELYKKKKTEQLLKMMELDALQNEKAHILSEGQKKRLVLALAFCDFPKLLLLDEPFSGLDPEFKKKVIAYLRLTLREQDASCIIVTHQNEPLSGKGDAVYNLINGRIRKKRKKRKMNKAGSNFFSKT